MMSKPYEQPEGSGRWVHEFFFAGKRPRLRLGKMTEVKAVVLANKIDELRGQLDTGASLLPEQVKWLNGLGDTLHARLAKHLPIPTRIGKTLGEWLKLYVESRQGLSPGGLRKLLQTCQKLEGHFGGDKRLRDITADAAAEWRTKLQETLSEATVKTHCGNAKDIFGEAVRRKILSESPMMHLASGSTAREDLQYVPAADVQKVIDKLDDQELKLRLAFCRFAGMRVDCEPPALLWSHIDLANRRIVLPDQKRKRYAGKKERIVPISDLLLPLLLTQFDQRTPGDDRVCKVGRLNGWHDEKVIKAIKAAGLTAWPALYQALRAAYDTDIRDLVPEYAANLITGHSGAVSRKHYTQNVPDDIMRRGCSLGSPKAAQNPAHFLRELKGLDGSARETYLENFVKNGHFPALMGSQGNGEEQGGEGNAPSPHEAGQRS